MNPGWPWNWRYAGGAAGRWALFLVSLWAIIQCKRAGFPATLLYPLALICAATVAVQFHHAYRLVAAQDEFVRALIAKRMLVAVGIAMVLVTAWSTAELAGLPHLPAWVIYPLSWGLYGVMVPIIRDSRP